MRISWGSDFAVLAVRHNGRLAVKDAHGALSYGDLLARAAGLADRLIAAGVRPGTPVATLVANGNAALRASLGVTLSGAAEVPLNPVQSAEERAWCLRLVAARHAVVPAGMEDAFPSSAFTRHVLEDIGPAPLEPQRWPQPNSHDWGRVLFTSGTTGRPKAVVHSHGGRWLATTMLRLALPVRLSVDDRILLMTPFAHGSSLLAYAFLWEGAGAYLMDGVRVAEVVDLIKRRTVNHIFAPPTVLAKIVKGMEGKRVHSIRTLLTGTATLSPALYRAARAVFGPVVRVTYGMTEVFNPITVLQPIETDAAYRAEDPGRSTPLGWPASGVELSIRDEAGREVLPGEPGEIYVRAPHMFCGYITSDGFASPAEDGFHATGDIGYYTATTGLYLLGRRHDVITTGGYKVFPEEIESWLSESNAAVELAVVGVPSEYWGEVVVAAVATTARERWQTVENAATSLTRYKRPRAYVYIPALPRNALGKVDRRALRTLILERYRLIDGPYPKLEPRTDCAPVPPGSTRSQA
ncbi:MAG: acyl--CoA ligase [Gammaproteobacteria bacterium]|nr:acyl--CoA ligase [Gammaproteobacteria bacterium]